MNSSAIKRSISLARLFNRWVFPSITAMTLFFIFLSSSGTYYALKPLIPPDRLDDARHIMFFANWGLIVAGALVLLTFSSLAFGISRFVTQPLAYITQWAEERSRTGEGLPLRLFTPIEEIMRLAVSFLGLFDKEAMCVRQVTNLVGSSRHNIRNHLSNIGCNAQFIRDGKRDPLDAAQRTLKEVKAATHILDINAEIAGNYSHILGDPPKEICVADLVHDCLDQLEANAFDKEVELSAEIPPDSLVAFAHRRNLESIIHNLVDNAIKYTPKGGHVSLAVLECPGTVTSAPSQLEIIVTDTGIGIPDADKPHVFEYAYRSASVAAQPGDGYGLNHVASVLSLYNGTSEIRDNAPRGTVITIRLPILTPPEQLAKSAPPESIPSVWTKLRALLIYPKSDSGWVYALLTMIPIDLGLATMLFYEWFGKTSILADLSLEATKCLGLYSAIVIGFKYFRLVFLKGWGVANTRLAIVIKVGLLNLGLYAIYFLYPLLAKYE